MRAEIAVTSFEIVRVENAANDHEAECGCKRTVKMALTIMLNALILLQAAMFSGTVQLAMAVTTYKVGGPAGWDFAPTATYYSDWASENTFKLGDRLSKPSSSSLVFRLCR